jgi:hypothetical protein
MPDFTSEGAGLVNAYSTGVQLAQRSQEQDFEHKMRQQEFGLQSRDEQLREQAFQQNQAQQALQVIQQQKADANQQLYYLYRDFSKLPQGTSYSDEQLQQKQQLTQRVSQLRDAERAAQQQILGPKLIEAAGQRDAVFDDLHNGRRSLSDLDPKELGTAVVSATGRPVSDFIDTPNSMSPVGGEVKAILDGMQAQQQGKGTSQLMSAFSHAVQPSLQSLVGQHAYDGSEITDAKLAALTPAPGNPSHVVPVVQITTKGADGRIGTQYRPLMSEDGHFLAHPDDTQNANVKTAALDGLFNHFGTLHTFYNILNSPGVKEKAMQHYLSGGEEGDQEIVQAMHALGSDPINYQPQKKVTMAGDRILIEDGKGNFQIIEQAPTAAEREKMALDRSTEAFHEAEARRQDALAATAAEGGKIAQEEAYIEQFARTHTNPDGTPMTAQQAASALQGMGLLKSPPGAGGAGGGGRQAVMNARILSAAKEGLQDLKNVMELPISANTGLLGLGGQQEHGLLAAPKNFLTREISSQNQQDYAVMQDGLGRAAAMMESQGLAPAGSLVSAVTNHLAFQPGETYLTRLRKVAQARQTFEQALEATQANVGLSPEQKQLASDMIDQVKAAIPFTQHDITELEKSKNPRATVATVSGYAQQQGLGGALTKPEPAAQPSAAAPAQAWDAASQKASTESGQPPINGKGWHLLGDGKGNYAYVSPDGKQHEEVSAKVADDPAGALDRIASKMGRK